MPALKCDGGLGPEHWLSLSFGVSWALGACRLGSLGQNACSSSAECLPDPKGYLFYFFLELQCENGYARSAPTSIYAVDVMLPQGAPPASNKELSVSFHLGCSGLMNYKGHLLGFLTKGMCLLLEQR